MAACIISLADERLIRSAPDHPLWFSAEEEAYILDCLKSVEAAFGIDTRPAVPIDEMPARSLMRRLIRLRESLIPTSDAQYVARRKLKGAIATIEAVRLKEPAANADVPHRH